MLRPTERDQAIVSASATEWTEKNASRYADFVENSADGREWFASLLAKAAIRAIDFDPSDIADRLASELSCKVDDELIDLADSYVMTHRQAYRKVVEQWAAGWGPKAPFEDFARVAVKGRKASRKEGIGRMTKPYSATAELLFLGDKAANGAVDGDGLIKRWEIIRFEDVEDVRELTPSDAGTVSAHLIAEAAREEKYAASVRERRGREAFNSLVKAKRPESDEAAMAKYRSLASSPEEAAEIVAALMCAGASLMSEPSVDEPRPAPGMLI